MLFILSYKFYNRKRKGGGNDLKKYKFIFLIVMTVFFIVVSSSFFYVYASADRRPDPIADEPEPEPGLLDILKDIIIPRDDFIEKQLLILQDQILAKLPFGEYISVLNTLNDISDEHDGDTSVYDIDIDLNGVTSTIPIGTYLEPFLPTIRSLVTGLYTIFFVYYNYRQIMFFIRGTNYQSMQSTVSNMSDNGTGRLE